MMLENVVNTGSGAWWHQAISSTNADLSLTHGGRVTHVCVGKLTIIGSDNGLSPGRHQAIIWTNAGILLNGENLWNSTQNIFPIHWKIWFL